MKKTILSLAILGAILTGCEKDLLQEESQNDSNYSIKSVKEDFNKYEDFFVRDKKSIAMKNFAEAFSQMLNDYPEVRSIVKREALKKFNLDTEILVSVFAETNVGGKSVNDLMNTYLRKDNITLTDILLQVPTITILVPELPEGSFSAEVWNPSSQIPAIGIQTSLSNNVPLVRYNGKIKEFERAVFPADRIPAFPVLVVKENERVVSSDSPNFKGKSDALKFHGSLLTGIEYKYVGEIFSSSDDEYTIYDWLVDNDKVMEAYDKTKGTNLWQRDHVYFDINSNNPRGPFDYNYTEVLGFFEPEMINGSALGLYYGLSENTNEFSQDPQIITGRNITPGWTEGAYEFEFHFLYSIKDDDLGNDGGVKTEYKLFNVAPDDIFDVDYRKEEDKDFFLWFWEDSDYYYYIEDVTSKKTNINTPVIPWDIQKYSTDVTIRLYERDFGVEHEVSISETQSSAYNFGFDLGVDAPIDDVKVKLGAKYGQEGSVNLNRTHKYTITQDSDYLGNVTVNFGDPVVISTQTGTFGYKTYSTGNFKFNVYIRKSF